MGINSVISALRIINIILLNVTLLRLIYLLLSVKNINYTRTLLYNLLIETTSMFESNCLEILEVETINSINFN